MLEGMGAANSGAAFDMRRSWHSAGAANMVAAQQLQDVGAVASERAAELYGLTVLDKGIQDLADNVTRFIVLSRCAAADCCTALCMLMLCRHASMFETHWTSVVH